MYYLVQYFFYTPIIIACICFFFASSYLLPACFRARIRQRAPPRARPAQSPSRSRPRAGREWSRRTSTHGCRTSRAGCRRSRGATTRPARRPDVLLPVHAAEPPPRPQHGGDYRRASWQHSAAPARRSAAMLATFCRASRLLGSLNGLNSNSSCSAHSQLTRRVTTFAFLPTDRDRRELRIIRCRAENDS